MQQLHGWQITIAQAQEIQQKLASQVSQKNEVTNARFIAGLDISAPNSTGLARAAAVVLSYPELEIPDLILVDGQGIAHPRRFGLASHLGLLLDTPSIGCAKSRLCGRHEPPTIEAGAYAKLVDNDEIIGVALRTKDDVNPIYVSIGHKIDLPAAIRWVLACCRGYRLPEPCRLAHLAASGRSITSHHRYQQRLLT